MTDRFSSHAAAQEGWGIVRGNDGTWNIERIASGLDFRSDEDARLFVVVSALEGSEYHSKALAFMKANNPDVQSGMTPYDAIMNAAVVNWVGGERNGEGCFVSHCHGESNGDSWQLQRDDEAEVFEDDDQAAIHVVSQAAAGSEYHGRVLRFLQLAQPNEHDRIMMLSQPTRAPSP